jgi:hypothetical protein
MMSSGATPFLQYWVAARPIPGQIESGDQYVVTAFPGGTLVAVIDGLGHGDDAADAAKLAAQTLAAHAHEPVAALMKRCHDELRGTRGAVMSIASFDAVAGTMNWVGIGNVEGMLLSTSSQENVRRASLLSRGGIVGDRLPQLNPATLAIQPGDLLLFATDGIGSMFVKDIRHMEHPRQLVHHIFVEHAKTTDDALILGAQWTNGDRAPVITGNSNPLPSPLISP